MRIIWIISAIAVVAILIFQLYTSWSMSDIEHHQYTVLKKDGPIEIRKYRPAIFASVQRKGQMFDQQNQSFRDLAGYIFGDNESSKSIAMTAPVQMDEYEDTAHMRFMIPSEYKLAKLPKPNNGEVQLNEEDEFYAVTISYSGFNNESKYWKYKKRLRQFVDEQKLESTGSYIFLGYNPPFQWINRRNEVMVKIDKPNV